MHNSIKTKSTLPESIRKDKQISVPPPRTFTSGSSMNPSRTRRWLTAVLATLGLLTATGAYAQTVAPLTFDTSIISTPNSAYTYNVGRAVSLPLPPATGGLGDLSSTLTGTIPDGLSFNDATNTLAGTPRTEAGPAMLTYTVTDSATPTQATAALTFMVTVASSAFITHWNVSPADPQITIPTTGDGYNYHVDWGDGETTTHNGNARHTYTDVGTSTRTYTVTLTGDFPRIHFNGGRDKDKIISINQWGAISWSSMENAFNGCSNLRYIATDTPDLSGVTNMSNMFNGANVFDGDIGGWVVDNVTDMSFMFVVASRFNQNIGRWNVSNVTNMREMFNNARAFNQNIGNWTVSKVTSMQAMFNDASKFNQNIGGWDVSNVTTMRNMFTSASQVRSKHWQLECQQG